MMLSESELNVIRQMWHSEQVVSLAGVGLLLDHIEAQEAQIAAMRETLEALVCGKDTDGEALVSLLDVRRVTNIALSGTAGQVPLDALAALELVSSEWKVLTEIDYLRADVQHLQDVAEAAKTILVTAMQACKGGYRGQPCPHGNLPTFPTHAWWCDPCFFALKERLEAAGYLREKADAE